MASLPSSSPPSSSLHVPVAAPTTSLSLSSVIPPIDGIPVYNSSNCSYAADSDDGLVFDFGTSTSRIGKAGDDAPSHTFPTIVGHPRHKGVMIGMAGATHLYGNDACSKRGILTLKYPMERGRVTNWDDMQRLYHHSFSELKVVPEEHPVLLSEPPLNPRANREQATTLLFEQFGVPCMYLACTSLLSLYASGRTTGLVVASGDSVTHVVPCYEGFIIPYGITRLELGGRDISDYLYRLLADNKNNYATERGYGFASSDILHDIKVKHAFASTDHDKDSKDAKLEQKYELPDGQVITMGVERYQCVEPMITPSILGVAHDGIAAMMHSSIIACDRSIYKDLYCNIIFSGGNTLIKGIQSRVHQEIRRVVGPNQMVMMNTPPERLLSSWIGGSILASLSAMRHMWITREEYMEVGVNVVHRKCI